MVTVIILCLTITVKRGLNFPRRECWYRMLSDRWQILSAFLASEERIVELEEPVRRGVTSCLKLMSKENIELW